MKRSRERDRFHLLKMRDASLLARKVVRGRKRSDLNNDELFQLGLAKAVELIGESANRISNELQQTHPQIPWRQIIGMRHVLVHNYWLVEMDEVWDAVQNDIPPLIDQLHQLIKAEEERRKR